MINFEQYEEQLKQVVNYINVCNNAVFTNRNDETEGQLLDAELNLGKFITDYATDCLVTFGIKQDHPKLPLIIFLAQDYCVVFKESYLRKLYCCLRDLAQLV